MKAQFTHEFMTSFMLWFDHHLLQKGEAYQNKTGAFYHFDDSRLPDDFQTFASPFKQWVSDSSITGDENPIIPTGFNGSGRADGIIFDFENGRILETGGNFNSGESITGTFAVKDFSIYLTNESEEDLILETNFQKNSRYDDTPSGIAPYDQVVPAVFINSEMLKNEGFAFGGEDRTSVMVKAIVFSENEYQLDGILSIFADTARMGIPPIPFTGHPATEYGDIKGGVYNYLDLVNQYQSANPYFIDDVYVSKLAKKQQVEIPSDLKIGFIDFEVSVVRLPRS